MAGRLILESRANGLFDLRAARSFRRPLEGGLEALDGGLAGGGWKPGAGRPDNVRLDDEVVRAADQQEMLDVVASQEDQLTLAVQVIDVDDAEPRLAGAAAILSWQHQSTSAVFPHEPPHQGEEHEDDREGDDVPGSLRGFDSESGQHVELSRPNVRGWQAIPGCRQGGAGGVVARQLLPDAMRLTHRQYGSHEEFRRLNQTLTMYPAKPAVPGQGFEP